MQSSIFRAAIVASCSLPGAVTAASVALAEADAANLADAASPPGTCRPVEAGRSKGSGGMGLGLVMRSAAEANRGRVEVESEQGRGSVFRIVLPAAASD